MFSLLVNEAYLCVLIPALLWVYSEVTGKPVYYTYLISVMATRSVDCCSVHVTAQVVAVNYRKYFRIFLILQDVF
jgi:hypothetical protein